MTHLPSQSHTPQIYIKNPATGEMQDLGSARFEPRLMTEAEPAPSSWLGAAGAEIKRLAGRISEARDQPSKAADAAALVDWLKFGNLPLRNRVLKALRDCPDVAVPGLLSALHSPDPALLEGALLSLGALASRLSADLKDRAFEAMKPFLSWPDAKVWTAAVSGIRYLATVRAKQALIAQLTAASGGNSVHLVQELAAFRDPALLSPVLEKLGIDLDSPDCTLSSIPLEAAFLLSPEWLAERVGSQGAQVMGLRFGYLDRVVAQEICGTREQELSAKASTLLREIGIASTPLLSSLRSSEDMEELLYWWNRRKGEFARAFFSDEYLLTDKSVAVSLESSLAGEIDRDIFFAALRELDRSNLEDKCEPRPFDLRHHQQSPGRFFYLPIEEFRNNCLPQYRQNAVRLLHPGECQPALAAILVPFIITELAGVDSETRPEIHLEAQGMLESRWRSLGRMLEIRGGLLRFKPDYQAIVAPEYPELSKKTVISFG